MLVFGFKFCLVIHFNQYLLLFPLFLVSFLLSQLNMITFDLDILSGF